MTPAQIDAAAAVGVPVVLYVPGLRFEYVPAGVLHRRVEGADVEVALDRGYFIQTSRVTQRQRARILGAAGGGDGPVRGATHGEAYVVCSGQGHEGVPAVAPRPNLGFRFEIPLGCGLGAYGATPVTFRLTDELASGGGALLRGGYDSRVISMNDRLRARTMNRDAHWQRVPDPGSPVTLTMVPGGYYVYAERVHGKRILRGKEMKFYVKREPVERLVPIPEKDQSRYGSGGREPSR